MNPCYKLAIPLLCLVITVAGQQPASQNPTEKIDDADVVRISTNLVQIDAVVTDKNGRQITDLKAEDFEVLQDGRRQKVTNLVYVATQPTGPGGLITRGSARAGEASVAAPVPQPTLRPDQVRRTIALVVDDLGLSFVSTAFVRRTLTKFINEQMQPGDLVAIIRTSAGAGALQQFTSDKRLLAAAIDRVRWSPFGRGGLSVFAPLEPDDVAEAANTIGRSGDSASASQAAANTRRLSENSQVVSDDLNELREQTFTVGTLGALSYVVRGLAQLPGRKSVLLLSDGFQLFTRVGRDAPSVPKQGPTGAGIVDTDATSIITNPSVLESLRRLTDLANRSSVVINTMDTRGLQTLGLTAADNSTGFGPLRLRQETTNRERVFFDTQAGLSYIARLSGGLAIRNVNDLNKGIQQVLDDLSGYYLIAYRPEESTFDPKTGGQDFHKITVKVNRPDLRVRSRSGFFGVADSKAKEARKTGDLGTALATPLGAADVHLRLTSLFGNDTLGSILSSVLHIDGHDLTFKQVENGDHESEIEVLAYTFGANGEVIDSLSRTHKIRAGGDTYESMIRDGLLYTVNVPIKKAGAYQLRIAVRDTASRRVGSASQFVEVPDLAKGRFALSGIFVSGLDPQKTTQPNAGAGRLMSADDSATAQASPALRRLRPSMEMHYAYYIYNAKLNTAHKPQLTTQIRLFHEGQLAYEGKVVEYDVGPESDMMRLRAGGQIKLSSKAAPGEYVLQVIVTDKLGKQSQNTATQGIDFQIVQ